MKFTTKTGLLGLLLFATAATQTADTPLTDVQKVQRALSPAIRDGQQVTDATLLYCIGDLGKNNASWLTARIKGLLNEHTETKPFTVGTGWFSSIAVTQVNYMAGTEEKLVAIYNGGCICGIKFTIANNTCTATYVKPEEVTVAFQKGRKVYNRLSAYWNIPHEFRLPYLLVGTGLATTALNFGLLKLLGYTLTSAVKTA